MADLSQSLEHLTVDRVSQGLPPENRVHLVILDELSEAVKRGRAEHVLVVLDFDTTVFHFTLNPVVKIINYSANFLQSNKYRLYTEV